MCNFPAMSVPLLSHRHFTALVCLLASGSLRGGELKVDFNRDSKNTAAETEVGYTKWSQDATGGASTGLTAITKSFITATGEAVTVSFAPCCCEACLDGE